MMGELETKLKKQLEQNNSKITDFQNVVDDNIKKIDRSIGDRVDNLESEMNRIKNIENF